MRDDAASFARIKALVIARTLHHYYVDKDTLLRDRLGRRLRATGLDETGYLALLERDDAAEWALLEAEITIGETFFFRFTEQFEALSDHILPTLLQARAGTRRLRIWSAGCASGAEAYSVAILLRRRLGAELAHWSLDMLGTDLSQAAIEQAVSGLFSDWTLRGLSPEAVARDFLPATHGSGRRWQVRPEIRAMVRFERRNLTSLLAGEPDPEGWDLVLCRNVLIYFGADDVAALLRRLGGSLAPDGWLLLGHAEAMQHIESGLRPVQAAGIVAWQRLDERRDPVPEAILELRSVPVLAIDPAAAIERVRRLADRGPASAALQACREALLRHPDCAELWFYAALLHRALGAEAEAAVDFRRATALRPEFVMAHYHLGLLLRDVGSPEAGRRAIDEAARIAARLPPDRVLPCGDGITASRLLGLSRRDLDPATAVAP